MPTNPATKARAPEGGPGLRHAGRASPAIAPAAHAGTKRPATPPGCPLGGAGVAVATTKPHAPETPEAAPLTRDTENCAGARRWRRQQRRLARHVSRPGVGLGLPLARHLIELHGGTLTLRSQQSVGTIAGFTLPPHRLIDPSPAPA
jgi:hypothetical protein